MIKATLHAAQQRQHLGVHVMLCPDTLAAFLLAVILYPQLFS